MDSCCAVTFAGLLRDRTWCSYGRLFAGTTVDALEMSVVVGSSSSCISPFLASLGANRLEKSKQKAKPLEMVPTAWCQQHQLPSFAECSRQQKPWSPSIPRHPTSNYLDVLSDRTIYRGHSRYRKGSRAERRRAERLFTCRDDVCK